MLQTFLQRSVWSLIWLATIAIAISLSADMASDQPILFAILLVCLAVVSVSMVYGRKLWAEGNRIAAAGCGFACVLALGLTIVSEVSYWAGTIEGVHDQITRDKARAAGLDLVQEKRRQQLAQHTGGVSPAEIEAQMQAELARTYGGKVLASTTNDCRDSGSPSYRFCSVFLALKSQLASAKQLQELEGKVLADSTQVVQTSVKRSFYEAARIGSEQIGGSPKAWVSGIVALVVATMLSLHLLSLYIGFAPVKSRATKSPPLPKANESQAQKGTGYERPLELSQSPVISPAPSQPLSLVEPLDDLLGHQEVRPATKEEVEALKQALAKFDPLKPLKLPEDPTPPGGGTRIPGPQLVVDNEADAFDVSQFFDAAPPTKAEAKGSRAKKKPAAKAGTGDVETWAGLHMKPTVDPGEVVTSKDAYACYETWCRARGHQPVHHKALTRKLNAILGRGQGKGVRAPRNGNGTVFQGFFLVEADLFLAEKKRARA